MIQKKYQTYIDLLEESHNLVLTGAPGTGKTFMAQEIAKEMGAETRFVQFHPSYDYTDFVEGLRPVEKDDGQVGFERKDGVFKEFCRDAFKNLVDSEKSIESLTKEISWQERLEQFVEDAIDQETKFKTVNGSEFAITDMKGRTIIVHNEQNEKTTKVAVNADDILELLTNEVSLKIVRDIRNYFNRKFGTQPDSYAYIITKAIRDMKQKMPVVEANKVERKPFVFIIDEINRGEASKIFGELFFAIDPGYRGKKETMVQTQYQNLVPETDVFAKGFYVPENVYILATMNDIDRSVESMDFAMRRRFTWKEVTPADTEAMLDTLTCANEAKATMARLNKAIAETDGLGAAYQIGPSYFLKLEKSGGDFNKLWEMNIEPLLKEYLRGFRKTSETLDKFKLAYFGAKEETTTDDIELIDED
ncbi:MAG: AAA family ATPase [Bacteroidales bacterium]|nr:AAA family ATPase [Bacteroidales bacterium]